MPKSYHLFKYNAASNLNVASGNDFTIVAHRGASAYYPENTMAAFEGAITQGADMVELDVQLTSDGEVVVFHDETISRCTDGRGKVGDHTLAQLKKLDAGSWFHKKYKGEKIPTLSEVLDFCKSKIAVNIEIKTEAVTNAVSRGIEEKCLSLVEENGMQKHVFFSSFDPRAVSHLKQINHQTPVAVLYEKKSYGLQLPSEIVASMDADAFNCSRRELGQKWFVDLKHHGIPVNVYTVNDERGMRRLLARGVDGIFTNYPDVLRRVVEDGRWKQDLSSNPL